MTTMVSKRDATRHEQQPHNSATSADKAAPRARFLCAAALFFSGGASVTYAMARES